MAFSLTQIAVTGMATLIIGFLIGFFVGLAERKEWDGSDRRKNNRRK